MKILITGGAGFIGSHTADALLSQGHQVRIYDALIPQVHNHASSSCNDARWPDYLASDCEKIHGDMRDRVKLESALEGVNVIYHLAARVGVGQSMYEIQEYTDVNVGGTATLLDIIANEPRIRERLSKIIVASSMSNYGEGAYHCTIHGVVAPPVRTVERLAAKEWEIRCPHSMENGNQCAELLQSIPTDESKPLKPNSIYASTKRTQEELFLITGRAYGIPAVALRFFNTYGSRQSLSNPYTGVLAIFCSRLLNLNAPIIYEDGLQIRDFVHISDLVDAALLVMDHPNASDKILNVGTGQPITILDVASTLSEFMDVQISPEIAHQSRLGDIRHCYPDISALKALGYTPKMSFEKGLDELVDWVQSQTSVDSFDNAQRQLQKRGLSI